MFKVVAWDVNDEGEQGREIVLVKMDRQTYHYLADVPDLPKVSERLRCLAEALGLKDPIYPNGMGKREMEQKTSVLAKPHATEEGS